MDLIIYTLRSISYVIVEPSLILMLILLGIVFYIKNRKLTIMQKMIMGESVNSPLELTLSQIVLGILAGIVASLILTNLGVVFPENSGIEILFMLSILLTFIKPRFVCFSYSAAILGVLSLIFNYFNLQTSDGTKLFTMDIMSLMTFVAVLHIVESILIMIDGDRGAIPVFSNKKGKIVGGYALKRYWVLPIAIFIAYAVTSVGGAGTQSIGTPTWWPILRNDNILNMIASMVLVLLPMFGMLGYSSVTFTRKKKEKAISSGLFTLGYGIILLAVAQLARLGLLGEIVVIAFAPIGHELMLLIQRKIEENRKPIFVSGEDGISILEVVPYSQASELGLRAGDKILTVNNKEINSEEEIYSVIKDNLNNFTLKVMTIRGEIKEHSIKAKGNNRLGLILVPKIVAADRVVSLENKSFGEVLEKIKDNKDKRNK